MKIRINHHSQGSVLLVTLLTGAVIGLALGSYLWMVSNQNISIAKTFAITERFRFTFTASASDAFNHPNFYLPAANISVAGSVGRISSMVDGAASRQVEVRGRLQF